MSARPSFLRAALRGSAPRTGRDRPRRRTFRSLLWALAAVLLFSQGALADEELVKEFRKYFRKFKDVPTRVEAVMALHGEQSLAVVEAMLPILKDPEPEVVQAAVKVLGAFKERPPIDALVARLAEEKDDVVRLGILDAFAVGGYTGTSEGLFACLEDKGWEVRHRAIVALAAAGDPGAAERIVPSAAAKEPPARCAALEALGVLGSPLGVEPAIAALADPEWQVRASAIATLGKVRDKRSIGPLIDLLEREEGRLQVDAAASLGALTGRSFGLRKELWRNFWNTYADRYELPSDEEMAKLRERQAAIKESYRPTGAVAYHGIETPSRSILFVIDVSGSMEDEVVEHERFADGEYPSMRRIDIVKTELARTIEGLEDYVEFNVLAFATEVDPWKKSQVKANVLNKKSALDWVSGLQAIGGASKQDLARNGLTGAANLEAGKTNTYGALMKALDAESEEKRRKTGDYDIGIDTVFFLSDGRPSHGEFTVPEDILREVKAMNELRKVVIHTIAIGQFQKSFMQTLAEQNGGTFVDLGK